MNKVSFEKKREKIGYLVFKLNLKKKKVVRTRLIT